MSDCEVCGVPATKKAKIDGIILDVCDECAQLGEPVSLSLKRPKKKTMEPEEFTKYIDPNYPTILKQAREKRGLKIEEVAKSIKEKESVLSRIERGELLPPFDLAKKLEKFFEVKIILNYEKKSYSRQSQDELLTIGDIAEIKRG